MALLLPSDEIGHWTQLHKACKHKSFLRTKQTFALLWLSARTPQLPLLRVVPGNFLLSQEIFWAEFSVETTLWKWAQGGHTSSQLFSSLPSPPQYGSIPRVKYESLYYLEHFLSKPIPFIFGRLTSTFNQKHLNTRFVKVVYICFIKMVVKLSLAKCWTSYNSRKLALDSHTN